MWLTADGVAVLDHDGVVGGRLRRRPIADRGGPALPAHIPTLDELYAECGTGFELSLDVKDADAAGTVIEVAAAAGDEAVERLWLCHPDLGRLVAWRERCPTVHLVDSTLAERLEAAPSARGRSGRQSASMRSTCTTPSGRGGNAPCPPLRALAFGWDAQFERVLHEPARHGHRRPLQRPRRRPGHCGRQAR